MNIKVIALDLDGTTLNSRGKLSENTKETLARVMARGIEVVIVTGRCFSALPKDVVNLEGLRYFATSNGAKVWDNQKDEYIYSNCINPAAVEEACRLLENTDFAVEAFIEGEAYISEKHYKEALAGKTAHRSRDYVISTRKPVADFFEFIRVNLDKVENINILFEEQEDKRAMKPRVKVIKNVSMTSSFISNWELGGESTNKGKALEFLCEDLKVDHDNVMAIGDSPNDKSMLKIVGLPIAMGNATEDVKAMAKFVSRSNGEDGAAYAIEKFTG